MFGVQLPLPSGSPLYALTMVIAIGLGAWFWIRQSKSEPRYAIIYFAAIAGALLGAKIAYLVSEGWLHTDPDTRLLHWLTGKSVTGALLGGWVSVELAKKLSGYTKNTGDRYALIVPHGIIIVRLGCLAHGCCQGIACDLGPFSTHGLDGKTLHIRYEGACGTCPSSVGGTLMAIENLLRSEVDSELSVVPG